MKTKTSKRPPRAAGDGRSKKRPGLEEQRRRILGAAVDLFRQQGSRGISISQLCAAADVSRPTFYKCFKDKEDLIYGLYAEAVHQPVDDIMLAGLASHSLDEDWIKHSLERLFDAIFDHASVAELVFMESSDPSSPAYTIVNNAFEKAADEMERIAVENGRRKPSRVYLKAIMAACQYIVHDAIRKGLDETSRSEAKAAAWKLSQGLLGH
jgi:TetR/AcrR family transcriptional regulator